MSCAPGEAKVELASMACKGIVDAIITDDSNAIVLGAPCVIVIKDKPTERDLTGSTEHQLMVKVYHAKDIETKLGLTHGDLITYAAIVGNDYDSGAKGIGEMLGLTAAKCGYAHDLVLKLLQVGNTHYQEECGIYLNQLCQAICDKFRYNIHGYLTKAHPAASNKLEKMWEKLFSTDLIALNAFIFPSTSWSGPNAPTRDILLPKLHNLKDIIRKCHSLIWWSDSVTLMKKLHESLWAGMILRMIALVHVASLSRIGITHSCVEIPAI
uniref:XPG-I domain-containing protein n=1 Tax=Moniliophthora roreri TaxID=221103 RepID=A0A0W0FY92_MONRR